MPVSGSSGDMFSGLVAVGKHAGGGGGVVTGPLPRYGELGGRRWALRRVSASQVPIPYRIVSSHFTDPRMNCGNAGENARG